MVSDADVALRLLEIVGLFLPLIAIFSGLAIRVVSREEAALGARRSELLLQGVLVTLVSLVLAGEATAGVVFLSTGNLAVQVAVLAIGHAVLGLGAAALATVMGFSALMRNTGPAEDSTGTPGVQQRLTRWATEFPREDERDGDG